MCSSIIKFIPDLTLSPSLLGFTLFGLSKAGLVSSDLSIASALLYGTITAAVDPVAVSWNAVCIHGAIWAFELLLVCSLYCVIYMN